MIPLRINETDHEDFDEPIVELWRDNEFVGYGAEIAAQIADKAFEWLDAPVRRYALTDVPAMPYAGSLENSLYPTPEGIVRHAQDLAKY